jgi:DNA polymerase-3 subunit alpha
VCEDLDLRLVNKRVFESLAKAGALDSIVRAEPAYASLPTEALRPRLIAALDAACEHGARVQRDRSEGQAQLFGFDAPGGAGGSAAAVALPDVAPWSEAEQLNFEKETLGLYWSGHPVDRYRSALKQFGARSTAELGGPASPPAGADAAAAPAWGPNGPRPIEPDTSIGGIISACRQLKTRKGERMAVFTLEDADGGVEVIAFPDAYQRSGSLIEAGTLVLVRGKLERDEESVRVLASEVAPLDSVRERLAREVAIHVRRPADRALFETLGEIFARHRGDRRVSFEIELPAEPRPLRVRADVSSQIRVRPSAALIAEVEGVVGPGAVELR